MATARLYRSSDTGVPALTGQTAHADLIAVLDAILINGYNSQTATSITRSGFTATVTKNSHNFVALQRVLVSGASPTDYNGEWPITNITTNTFDYVLPANTASTPATGTITIKAAPAGWSIGSSAATQRMYQTGAGSHGRYMFVDDTLSSTARFAGYEKIVPNPSTEIFPNNNVASGGLYWNKSNTVNNVARGWIAMASENILYFWSDWNSSVTTRMGVAFGDFISYNSNDPYNTIVIGAISSTLASNSTMYQQAIIGAATDPSLTGHYASRNFLGLTRGNNVGKGSIIGANQFGGTSQYPNPVTGGLELEEIYVLEWGMEGNTRIRRGKLPGIWDGSVANTFTADLNTYSGTGTRLNGKTFIHVQQYNASAIALETSNTWATS